MNGVTQNATESFRQDRVAGVVCLVLAAGLPLLSHPLAWLPVSAARFGYRLVLPIPELVLLGVLLTAMWRLAKGGGVVNAEVGLGVGGQAALNQPVWWCWAAVLVSAVISTVWSQLPGVSLEMLLRVLGCLAIFVVATRVSSDGLIRLGWVWVATGVVVTMFGLWGWRGSEREMYAFFGNRNLLGTYLGVSVVMGMMCATGSQHWWMKGLAIVAVGVFGVGLGLTSSRGAVLALVVAGVIWVVAWAVKKGGLWRGLAGGVVMAGATLLGWQWEYVTRQWNEDVRPVIWRGAITMAEDRLVAGHGLGTFEARFAWYRPSDYSERLKTAPVTDHAHNELLEVAAEQGVIGLAAVAGLWLAVLAAGVGSGRMWFVWASGVMMAHGWIDVSLRSLPNQGLLWLVMGLTVGGVGESAKMSVGSISRAGRMMAMVVCGVLALMTAWMGVWSGAQAGWWTMKMQEAESRSDYRMMIERGERVLQYRPYHIGARMTLAEAYARWAMAYDATGKAEDRQAATALWEASVRECEALMEMAPDYAGVPFNLAQMNLRLGRVDESVRWLDRVLARDPKDWDAQELRQKLKR